MDLSRIGTAAVLLALAAPATAHAAKTVQSGEGACTSDDLCGSLADAAAGAGNDETVSVTPGTWIGNATFAQTGLTLAGTGSGQAFVNGTLSFTGGGALTLKRLVVRGQSGSSALSLSSGALAGDRTVSLQSTILSGSDTAAAIAASTDLPVNEIAITARHVTISDSGSAPAVTDTQNGGSISTTFHNSIVHGSASDTVSDSNDTDASAARKSALFVNVAGEDFRLRVGSPAIDQGQGPDGGEVTTDVEGEARSGTWDRGADELVNHAPNKPGVGPPGYSPLPGETVSFFAASGDPDEALGDSVMSFIWNFGDGTTSDSNQHAYASPGTYQVTAQAVDRFGAVSAASDPVTIVVRTPPAPAATTTGGFTSITQLPGFGAVPNRGPDGAAPVRSFTSPRPGQRVRIGRRVPMLRGRVSDPSGVRRVELALVRREGARCRWFDGRGAFRLGRCTAFVWFRATVDDATWRFAFPRLVRPRSGAYFAFIRATDFQGNRNGSFDRMSALGFRYVR